MEHTVDHDQMEALKALSDTNLKISEAKKTLFDLQEGETEYLVTREKKVLDRIQEVLDDSRSLVDETKRNWAEVKELSNLASSFAGFLIELHGKLKDAWASFEERNVAWEREIGLQQDEIAEARKEIKAQWAQIKGAKEGIARAHKLIAEDKVKIKDQWGEIERAIKRLRENRV